jgi:hypothetical protein
MSMDTTQPADIQPSTADISIPSFFSNAWNKSVGVLTTQVEQWYNGDPSTNSMTAVAHATLPGQPSTTAANAAMAANGAGAESALLSPFKAISSFVSSAVTSTENAASSAWSGVTGTATGISSLLKYLVIGAVALAIIAVISQLRLLEGK